MNRTEIEIELFARVIKSGHEESIQEVLKTLPEVPFTVEILDKCNIACLIDQFVPNLAPATDFARRIRKWRNASMQREKAKIVKYFTYGTLYDFGGTFVPDHVLKLLTDMMCFDDLALVKCAFKLLGALELSLADFEYYRVHETAAQFQYRFVEADELVRKIEQLRRELSDESLLDQDIPNLEMDNFDQTELLPKLLDNLHLHGDQEEGHYKMMENYEWALWEVLMVHLVQSIKTGNRRVITRAIIHHQEHRFPLALYRKYEIQSLIRALPRKISAASQLFDEIELIEESTLNSQHIEAFREVKKAVNGMEEGEEAWPVLMSLMMGFLKQDDGFVHGAVELLLNCNISRERFVEFAVENTLLNLPYRTEEINELLVKIRSMEPRQ
ncbi:SKN-1 Dependent Zygotic transcript [Caenorhabditis elegans]|uniref:SKN-1 Dependent Zygotic transcript n=1 Tax=Caenorhabditis elegans TaxID=6239 RepID=O62331_CAEEL|nr:SKN-1 Dependent Zygotic transcript [Caenorhabditis elegans]CAB05585.2 SKN-1 Dependent Zygotic transcript [Caenorhabditis elegans]|eukprot:NP_496991.2 SKN-1 Dependent Zygotic transcript [Caenorhabditis elegans]